MTLSKFFFTLSLVCFATVVSAQISEPGTPWSFAAKNKTILKSGVDTKFFTKPDITALAAEDAVNDQFKDRPWRFGFNHFAQFSLTNSGTSIQLPNGNSIWMLGISCEEALSINLILTNFHLEGSSKLYVFNEDKTHLIGAFTSKNNSPEKTLGLDLIEGNKIYIELDETPEFAGKSTFTVSTVTHGYRSLVNYAKTLGASGSCNVNVACPQGIGWENEINSVAVIVVNGNESCTGALVNNACQDGTPYFLTANHCLGGSVAAWVFRFKYESPTCSTSVDGPYSYTISGATKLANSSLSDFALLELSSAPPANFDPYYAGWDRTGNTPTNTVGIHHPSGDVKKISFDNDPATYSTMSSAAVWEVAVWDLGTTEPGSSGSPLFDQNHRVIGQLFGGTASCSSLTSDNYGRFDISWTGGGSASNSLSSWLSNGCGSPQILDGFNPFGVSVNRDLRLYQPVGFPENTCDSNFTVEVYVKNNGFDTINSYTVGWTLDAGAQTVITRTNTFYPGSFDTLLVPITNLLGGSHNFLAYALSINNLSDQNSQNDSAFASTYRMPNPVNLHMKVVTDDYGSETSWEIKNTQGQVFASGGGFQDVNGGETIVEDLCIAAGCYKLYVYDAYGDGICCSYGNGSYLLYNDLGDTLVYGDGQFNSTINHNFCAEQIDCTTLTLFAFEGQPETDLGLGSVTVHATGGYPPYVFTLNGTTTSDSTFTNLPAGTYPIVITDAANCSYSAEIIIGSTVSIEEQLLKKIELYPNPASSQFSLAGLAPNMQIMVINTLSQVVFQTVITTNETILVDNVTWANGMYFVSITNGSATSVHKLIVNH